jgi:hypothetical protein
MDEDHWWMYGGWKKGGGHTKEWINKTKEFIDYAFSLPNNRGMKCPCSKCRNSVCEDKRTLSLHLCKVSFMPAYEVWVHHNELVRQAALVVEDDDSTRDDRMDEMLDAIRPQFGANPKDPPTLEVPKFFDILRASVESLHEHTTVSVLAFTTHLITIKSKFAFSINCYNDFLNLISDVLPMNHKMLKDMYQSKNAFCSMYGV